MPAQTQMMQAVGARQLAAGDDASAVAATAITIWKEVGAALAPIIGQTGVAALFKRSIHVTRSTHPWLAPVIEDGAQPDELAAMHAALAQQTSANAAAANVALLQNFQNLLISLIGLSLTERLLSPVWGNPSNGQAEQDTVS